MIMGIERAQDDSLILIEEIENGLHPLATLRLVDYLINVAERKRLQIIFTTHSEYAIEPLPAEAVWASLDGSVMQGKLDINSLRSLRGEVNSAIIIFTEDEFAKEWVLAMLRYKDDIATDAVEVFGMGGDGVAVNANKYHNNDPSKKTDSICIIDGDSSQIDNDEDRVFRLPGEAPESYIFDEIMDVIDECAGILAVRCMRKFADESRLKDILKDVRQTNYDHHLIYSKIGEKLGFVSESVIRSAFLTTWCEQYSDTLEDFISQFVDCLPVDSDYDSKK